VLSRCRQEWAIDEEEATFPGNGAGVNAAEDKIATRRTVEDAKVVLMERYGMSEPDAFSFVQRTAMQTRARMRDVADRVVGGELHP
jgi:two-component system, response regulator PdtaR